LFDGYVEWFKDRKSETKKENPTSDG